MRKRKLLFLTSKIEPIDYVVWKQNKFTNRSITSPCRLIPFINYKSIFSMKTQTHQSKRLRKTTKRSSNSIPFENVQQVIQSAHHTCSNPFKNHSTKHVNVSISSRLLQSLQTLHPNLKKISINRSIRKIILIYAFTLVTKGRGTWRTTQAHAEYTVADTLRAIYAMCLSLLCRVSSQSMKNKTHTHTNTTFVSVSICLYLSVYLSCL